MKLVMDLAVVLKEGQDIMELLKPYLKTINNTTEEGIKEKRNFLSGIILGDFDSDTNNTDLLVLKDNKGNDTFNYIGMIKDVNWQKTVDAMNEQLENLIKDGDKWTRHNLTEFFPLTNAIITPDGKWHGMLPLNLVAIGFKTMEEYKEYGKNYYTQYIKPYEKDGKIIILSCNV